MTAAGSTTDDLTCPRDDVPTKLTCAQCGTPICPACFVRSPVGLKCQTCVPDAPKQRVGNHWRVVASAVAAVAAIALVLGPRLIGSGAGPAASDAETGIDASAADAGLNQELNVGPMVVTVTRVDCAGNQLGTPPVTRISGGKYCAAYLSLRNTGAQPEYFGASIQELSDGSRRYGPDLPAAGTTAPTLLTLDSGTRELLGVRLNPDQRGSYAMIFDVPVDFKPKQLLLRFTPRSPRLRISVGV